MSGDLTDKQNYLRKQFYKSSTSILQHQAASLDASKHHHQAGFTQQMKMISYSLLMVNIWNTIH